MVTPLQDPFTILTLLATLVAVVFQVARLRALAPLFSRIPALVWIYFLPMLATSIGLLPSENALYHALARYLLPASLSLLLLSSEVRVIVRLGRTALLAMAAGSVGILLGSAVAFALLHRWLPDEAWKAVGALSATWIGGSANLLAVATALGLSPALQGVVILVDTLVGYTWMGILIALAPRQDAFDRFNGADGRHLTDVSRRVQARTSSGAHPLGVHETTLMVGIALGLTGLCLWLGAQMPHLGAAFNPFSWAILLLTALALLLSLTPLGRLEAAGASSLGSAGFYLLLASVGAQADLRGILAHPLFALLGVIIILVHATVLFLAVRWLRAPFFFFGAASQACMGGYSSAPIVAAIYQPGLAAVGLLLAVLGNIIGTSAGLLMAEFLHVWPQ